MMVFDEGNHPQNYGRTIQISELVKLNLMKNHELIGGIYGMNMGIWYTLTSFGQSHFEQKSKHCPFLLELGMKPLKEPWNEGV